MLGILRLVIGSTLGKIIIGTLVLFGWWQVDRNAQYRSGVKAGENKVIEDSVKKGKENAAKSKKSHAAASKPGAADRLRKNSCRDC